MLHPRRGRARRRRARLVAGRSGLPSLRGRHRRSLRCGSRGDRSHGMAATADAAACGRRPALSTRRSVSGQDGPRAGRDDRRRGLSPESLLEVGRAAPRAGDAAAARRPSSRSRAAAAGDVLEGLAAPSPGTGVPGGHRDLGAGYAAHHDAGDQMGAVRGLTLGYMYAALLGDWAVSSGWWPGPRRGRRRGLPGSRLGGAEHRHLRTNPGGRSRFSGTLTTLRRGRRFDLEVVALGYLGASVVDDRTDEGMALLDEAWRRDRARSTSPSEDVFCRCSRPASTPPTSPAPTSGSASATGSPSAATCPPSPPSVPPTTADC